MKKVVFWLLISLIQITYSPVLAQSFFVGDTLSTNITYCNIPDTSILLKLQSTAEFKIDIDEDQLFDFKIIIKHTAGQLITYVWQTVISLDSVQFACDTSDFNVDTLILMSPISKDLNWKYNPSGARLYEECNSQAPPPWGPPSYKKGLFRKDSLFLGFRKIQKNDTLYGWLCLDCKTIKITIKSFAVNRDYSILAQYYEHPDIKIYPNPTNDFVTIENFAISGVITIYDLNGRIILEQKNNQGYAKVNLAHLKNGLYFMKFESNKFVVVRKIIKG